MCAPKVVGYNNNLSHATRLANFSQTLEKSHAYGYNI